jgi:hypothetical protein
MSQNASQKEQILLWQTPQSAIYFVDTPPRRRIDTTAGRQFCINGYAERLSRRSEMP